MDTLQISIQQQKQGELTLRSIVSLELEAIQWRRVTVKSTELHKNEHFWQYELGRRAKQAEKMGTIPREQE